MNIIWNKSLYILYIMYNVNLSLWDRNQTNSWKIVWSEYYIELQ